MLVSFRVKNFRSFVDKALELRCEEGTGREVGEGLPWVMPVLGMCGEAAAEEGAVWVEAMRAFHLVASLMPLSPQIREVVWKPNEEHPELKETEYSIEMTLNGWLYRYTLAHNGEGVLREELWREEKPLYRIDHAAETYEFAGKTAGHGSAEEFRCVLAEECMDEVGHQTCTLLWRMGIFHGMENRELAEVLLAVGGLQINVADELTPEDALLSLSIRMNNENGENALREVERLLKKLDVGVEGLKSTPAFRDIVRACNKQNAHASGSPAPSAILGAIKVYRRTADGKKQPRLLKEEPEEVRTLFALCCTMLSALRTGDSLFLADLDGTLPPRLLHALISLFADPAANKRGAQLLYTARNSELSA